MGQEAYAARSSTRSHIELSQSQAIKQRLLMALGHLMAAEGLARSDQAAEAHIQEAKRAVVAVLRQFEPPLEAKHKAGS